MINYFKRAIDLTKRFGEGRSDKNFHKSCLYVHLLELIGEETFNMEFENTMDDFERFHKSFRQTDVTGNPHIDMIMWNFIILSELPQEIHFGIQNRNFDGSPQEEEWLNFDGVFNKL